MFHVEIICTNAVVETGGGILPPTVFTSKFYDLPRKKGQGREMERKRRKIWKRRSGKLKMEGDRYENEQRTSFYLFIYLLFLCLFIYLFCLSLFETTEVCLGSTNMDSFTRKIIFHAGTKSGNLTLPPPKNITPTPLHRFSDSTIYDYNDTWYSTPLSFNLKPLCLSKFEKHCVVWHLCWISALFFRFE